MSRQIVLRPLVAALVAVAFASAARGGEPEHQNLERGRVAVQGYDVVSYFFAGAAKGNPALAVTHNGAVYHFANEFNRKLFAENPTKFAPAYGGWCATAMADGRKVEIDPANFKVSGGRLLLFYKGLFANAQTDWNKDEAKLTTQADANWKKLTGG